MGNKRFGKRKALGSLKWNRTIKKVRLKRTNERLPSRAVKIIVGYKEYDTVFIQKPKNWKKWRDTQYKPVTRPKGV